MSLSTSIFSLRFQYELHTDVYRIIDIESGLESRFTHFAPYVVYIGISKNTYI